MPKSAKNRMRKASELFFRTEPKLAYEAAYQVHKLAQFYKAYGNN